MAGAPVVEWREGKRRKNEALTRRALASIDKNGRDPVVVAEEEATAEDETWTLIRVSDHSP